MAHINNGCAPMNLPESPRILRLSGVKAKTGKSTSAIYADMTAGTFPKSVPLGPRTVGWLEHEITEWITARIAERDRAS
jgi:prophage regulatory protein